MAIISSSLLMDVLITSCTLIVAVYFYFRCVLYNYWKRRGVVYVEPTIPTGNFGRVLRGKMCIGQLLAEAYVAHKNNRYFGMYAFHKPRLVISDPDLIKQVLTREFSHFEDRGLYCNEEADPLGAHLFFLTGNKWRNLRKKVVPTFTSGKLKRMFPAMAELGVKLTQNLESKAETRQVFQIKDIITRYTIDIIMSVAFGVTSDTLNNSKSEFEYWSRKIFDPKPLKTILAVFAPKIMHLFSVSFTDKKVANYFNNVFKDTVAYREENDITPHDFLDSIMQLMKRGYVDNDSDEKKTRIDTTIEKISMLDGAALAFMFFLAGYESAASTMSYCLFEMACNQDIQDNAANDIDFVIGQFGGLTWESLQEMTYLDKCLAETLRKYPKIPMLDRVCTQDIDLPTMNLRIKKGLEVTIPIFGIHRDPEIYPDPDKFDPERFTPENIAARHRYVYLPFGEGPRACIGKKFGMDQAKIGLISILSKYRVRLGPNTSNPLQWATHGMLLVSKYPIDVTIEPRQE